ncbi:unnamed protein product [marine sediment metagenome]|uniref:Uncharacterized protein n=1 Tax=marine sediment metagenome TaxID=412755 RepID=X1A3V6_9ZZZZ
MKTLKGALDFYKKNPNSEFARKALLNALKETKNEFYNENGTVNLVNQQKIIFNKLRKEFNEQKKEIFSEVRKEISEVKKENINKEKLAKL